MKELWFVVGSQDLYGEEVLKTVEKRSKEMAKYLSSKLPYKLTYKVTGQSSDQITSVMKQANFDDDCFLCCVDDWCVFFCLQIFYIYNKKYRCDRQDLLSL